MKKTAPLLVIIRRSILPYLLAGVAFAIIVMTPFQLYSFFRFYQGRQRELTTTISSSIDQYLTNADTALRYLSDDTLDQIGEHLGTFRRNFHYFDRLLFADRSGRVIHSAPEAGKVLDISNIVSHIESSPPFTSHFSSPFISPGTGKLTINTIFTIPREGYLLGELNLDFLQEQILETVEQTLGKSLIFVTDRYGNMLIHPDKRLVEEQVNWGAVSLLKEIRESLANREGFYSIQGSSYLASGTYIPGVEWILVDGIGTDQLLLDMIKPILLMILVLFSLFSGLMLIIAHSLTRNIVNPLTYMFHILERSVIEEEPQPIDEIMHSFNELETVRGAFNVLINKITQNTRKLGEFERAVGEAGYAIYITDRDGTITYVNPAFERITGFSEQEAMGKDPKMLSSGMMPEIYFTSLWDSIQKGELWEEEIINRRKDGSIYYANQTIAPITDEEGRVSSYVAIQNDVTHQREADRRLRESETLYRNLFENAADSILLISPDTFEITECNQAAWKHLGYTRDEMHQIAFFEIQHPDSWPEVQEKISLLQHEHQVNFDSRQRTKSGEAREVSINLTKLDFGKRPLLLAMIHDMTERKYAEEAIRQSEKKYRLLAENSTDMISQHTPDGTYLYASPACQRLLGYTQEEMIGKNSYELFHPEDIASIRDSHIKIRDLETDGIASVTYRIHKKDGSWIWFETLSKSIYLEEEAENAEEAGDARGAGGTQRRVQEIIAISRDVSERVEMERALAQAKEEAEDANRAKSSFLANMSHEIRTPLNAVLGYNELINRSVQERKLKEYSRQVEKSGRILLTLIGDILDFSRIEAGGMQLSYEPFDPRQLSMDIKSMFDLEAEKRGLEFKLIMEDDLPGLVVLDEARVRQVLINLSGNAIKFTESGSVSLFLRSDTDTPEKGQCNLFFAIQDTGIGIPPYQQEKIFEAFRQTEGQSTRKYGGTGLGLAISKSLTEAMGGSLTLKSEIGKGSTFSISFTGLSYIREAETAARTTPEPELQSETIEEEKPQQLADTSYQEVQSDAEDSSGTELSADWKSRWEEIKSSMILDDIERFALELEKEGGVSKKKEIRNYASALLQAVEDLDFEALNRLFTAYPF
jgi:PAS domain S-box-containing protein